MKKLPQQKKGAKTATPKEPAKPKYPVPEWWDETLKECAANLDMCERQDLAAKLENQAIQLRGFKQPPIKKDFTVVARLQPSMKRALIAFYKRHCGKENLFNEKDQAEIGLIWFLEGALPLIDAVTKETNRAIRYRDAEGLENSVYVEDIINQAVSKYEERTS